MNPYETLGVPKDADAKTIKRARQRKARELHPDRNKDPAAAEEMSRCNLAYDILVDPVRRANYDKTGHARVTPIEEDARKLVIQAFRAHLHDAGPPRNVVRLVIEGLEGMLGMARDEKRQLTAARDKLAARRDELETDDELNLWAGIIDGELEGLANQLANNAHGTEAVKLALEAAKRYRSRVKENPQARLAGAGLEAKGWP